MKTLKKIVLSLLMLMPMVANADTISQNFHDAESIKETINSNDDFETIANRTTVIGITKFTPGNPVSGGKIITATIDYGSFNNHNYEELNIYYYDDEEWFIIDDNNKATWIDNTKEDNQELLDKLNNADIYYVDNKEKVLTVDFAYKVQENEELVFVNSSNESIKKLETLNSNYDEKQLVIPATALNFSIFVENSETKEEAELLSYTYIEQESYLDIVYKLPEADKETNEIVLTNDVSLRENEIINIGEGQTVTIDLNGYVLAANNGKPIVNNGGTLIIKDSTNMGYIFVEVANEDEFFEWYNLDANVELVLANDLEITNSLSYNKQYTKAIFPLNTTLTYSGPQATIENGASLIFRFGNVDIVDENPGESAFIIEEDSSVILEGATVTSKKSVLYPRGENATVKLLNGAYIETSGYYGISTNANLPEYYGVVIDIKNSTVIASRPDGITTAILMNVAGTLNIDESLIVADHQSIFVRAGEADIKNTDIKLTRVYADLNQSKIDSFLAGKWGSGSLAPSAALLVGNYNSDAYKADANVNLENVELIFLASQANEANIKNVPMLYLASGKNGYTTSVTGASEDWKIGYRTDKDSTITLNGKTINAQTVAVSSSDDLKLALEDENVKEVDVLNDITVATTDEEVNTLILNSGLEKIINLNSHTVKYTTTQAGKRFVEVTEEGSNLTFKNGKLDISGLPGHIAAISATKGTTVVLDAVEVKSTSSVLFPSGDAAKVDVINSTITTDGYYGIGTNDKITTDTNDVNSPDYTGIEINIDNSTITANRKAGQDYEYEGTGVLINVKGTLNIRNNSEITGNIHGVVVRAGEANITDSTITVTGEFAENKAEKNNNYLNGSWGTGNEMPSAGVVVGNYASSSYAYDAVANFENVEIVVHENVAPELYLAAGGNGKDTIVSGSLEDWKVGYITDGKSTITLNEETFKIVSTQKTLENALNDTQSATTVYVAAGTYNVNGLTVPKNTKLIGLENVVFEIPKLTIGTPYLTINEGVMIENIKFNIQEGVTDQTKLGVLKLNGINITLKDCSMNILGTKYNGVLIGGETANADGSAVTKIIGCDFVGGFEPVSPDEGTPGNVLIESTTFDQSTYSIHLNTTKHNLLVKDCDLVGWTTIYGTATDLDTGTLVFDNCNFKGTGNALYTSLYRDTEFKNCNFDEEYGLIINKSNQGGEGPVTIEYDNCVYGDGSVSLSAKITSDPDFNKDFVLVADDKTYDYTVSNKTWTIR